VKVAVLSDLHLGATADTSTEDAFVSFLEWLAARAQSDSEPWRLVLLGDLFDLLHPPADASDPLAALNTLAVRHRTSLAALGAATASGVVVDLVPGNHDSELLDADLQDNLRVLVADAAAVSAAQLRPMFHVRPWFVLLPGLLYAEHGSQYHALNAVADPLAPFGRWSRRLPPGAVLDLFLRGAKGGARPRALLRLLPAVLRAAARRRRTDAATIASLQAHAQRTGLSLEALRALRGLAEDSWAALLRNLFAATLGRAGHVEARQQNAVVAVHRILVREGREVPVYAFGHTHRIAHGVLHSDGAQLLWANGGAWADGNYCFTEVEGRAGRVVARLRQWNPAARAALTRGDPLPCAVPVAQEGAPTTPARNVGNTAPDPVTTP
jgi:UDP-2,3-diacylglucosamine pyrophosphatase LpxH